MITYPSSPACHDTARGRPPRHRGAGRKLGTAGTSYQSNAVTPIDGKHVWRGDNFRVGDDGKVAEDPILHRSMTNPYAGGTDTVSAYDGPQAATYQAMIDLHAELFAHHGFWEGPQLTSIRQTSRNQLVGSAEGMPPRSSTVRRSSSSHDLWLGASCDVCGSSWSSFWVPVRRWVLLWSARRPHRVLPHGL